MKIIKEWEGRDVIFIASYGSTNYGTRTPESDNDYKVFVMPTFEDVYKGKMFSSNPKIDGDDYEFHDIRKIATLFYKANPAYLEILEAKEIWINPKYEKFVLWIFKNKHRIAKMNLKSHFKAINGMATQKKHAIIKDLPNSDNNEGYKRRMKFGFDTKQLMHVIRLCEMRNSIFLSGFNPLSVIDLTKEATRYNSCNIRLRDYLLEVKSNKFNLTKEGAIKLADVYLSDLDDSTYTSDEIGTIPLIDHINSLPVDEEMNQLIENKIIELIKKNLFVKTNNNV